MRNDLKTAILEIVEIVKSVPEPLQGRCSEMLLADHLESQKHAPNPRPAEEKVSTEKNGTPTATLPAPDEKPIAQADIQLPDLHLKAKKFLEKHSLSIADLNEVFYKEGADFKPLFDYLKTTKLAESQIRIAMLEALKSGLTTGDFQFDGEVVRAECQVRKCYDGPNFAANFKNNSGLFEAFEGYKKATPIIRLSETGRNRLAELITELKS